MANKELGELSMDIGGETYTMSLTIDAMVRLEEMFSTDDKIMTFQQVAALADRGSMKHVRAMLWAVFVVNHPELKIEDMGKLIAKGGGLARFTKQLEDLAKASNPDPKDLQALGVKTPRPAQANGRASRGTGAVSTSTPGASV